MVNLGNPSCYLSSQDLCAVMNLIIRQSLNLKRFVARDSYTARLMENAT